MVICPQKQEDDTFILKMLTRNKLDSLLKMEVKMIDNQKYYYYDITSKQPLSEVIKTSPVSFKWLKKIYQKIFQLPEILKEYLITEEGVFIEPDFIYVDQTMDMIEFCYYPVEKHSLQKQVAELTEYLINKVDYNDEKAVLTIYAIYQVSHDNHCTLKKLKEVFEKQCNKVSQGDNKTEVRDTIESLNKKNQENLKKEQDLTQKDREQDNIEKRIKKLDIEKTLEKTKEKVPKEYPYMEERIEEQREVMKYPPKIYMQAVIVLVTGVFFLFLAFKAELLNKNGLLDQKRCILAISCYILAETISFFIIFRKENQCARIKEEIDYIDWEDEYDLSVPEIRGLTLSEPIEENYYQDAFLKETKNSNYEEDSVTELLVDFKDHSIAYLESEFSGERIYFKKFPFLVGKLKKGVDYVLESNKISRVHAKFDYDDSHYYIEDMDSTNGTSLNGESLYAHSQKVISEGDRICFADKNFIFHC